MDTRPRPPLLPRLAALTSVLLAGALFCGPLAAEVRVKSDTLIRGFERDTAGQDDAAVIPVYEYLQLDAGSLNTRGLAFHFYGWGRNDLGDGGFYRDDSSGELLFGYLEYTRPFSTLNVRLGRQYVFEGVSNESIDGLRVSTGLTRHFTLSAYGGQPVALDSEHGRDGDSIIGGRVAHLRRSLYEVGLSYKKVGDDSNDQEEMLGVDLSLFLPAGISLYGLSNRNLETEGWAEHSYELRIAAGPLLLRPFFEYFEYDDTFGTGTNSAQPFPNLSRIGEKLTVYGGELSWLRSSVWDLGLRGKFYTYNELDSSQYYSALATWHGKALTQVGGELGYMKGDAADNDYLLGRLHCYLENLPKGVPLAFLSGELIYTLYDEEIYNEDDSFFLSLGAGQRFLSDALEVKLSGDYAWDAYYDSDLRGMLVFSYTFQR